MKYNESTLEKKATNVEIYLQTWEAVWDVSWM